MGKRAVVLWLCAGSLALLGFQRFAGPQKFEFPALPFFPPMPQSPGNPVTVEGVRLGRFLFYDSILSADYSFSCATCHRQQSAFADGGRPFSKGSGSTALRRNTLPLFNLAWQPTLFWDGRAATVEDQVFHPVRAHDEMNLRWPVAVRRVSASRFYRPLFQSAFGHAPIDSALIARAIAQFERTILSYRSRYDAALAGKAALSHDETEGFVLMNDMTKGDCLHCHVTDGSPLGSTFAFSNNGLDTFRDPARYPDQGRAAITGRPADAGKFKVPSLRNAGLTPPYMHDGRFATLEDVVDFYNNGVHTPANVDSKMGFAHRGGTKLSKAEQRQIMAFLHTLSDSSLITDPAYSNPFRKAATR